MVTSTLLPQKTGVSIPRKKVGEFCRRWKIAEMSLFGSILRQDFTSNSDIDLLVTFKPNAKISLFDLIHMQNELNKIFGRKVDLVERQSIEKSENYIRRKNILSSTKVIYAAR